MKKHLCYLAAAVVAMSSCTESEVVEISQSKAIGFDGYVGNMTRAEQEGLTKKNLEEFYAFGAYTTPDKTTPVFIFDGKTSGSSQIKKNDGNWQYAPVNYWLEGATYKFAAYAPALDKVPDFDYATNKMTIKNFKATGSKDLLIAATHEDGIKALKEKNPGVSLNFKHALSKVRFTITDDWRNELKMSVENVKLTGVKGVGTLTTPADLSALPNLSLDMWSISTDATITQPTYQDINGTGSDYLTNNGDTYIFENFLLPQNIADKQMSLTFTVSVTNNSGGGPIIGDDADHPHTKTLTVTIPNDTYASWTPGNSYNYILKINGATFGLQTIYFDNIEVSDWTKEEDKEIETENLASPAN
ncbi:fimbrillin family protein [uncultured Bacteroides sp.]|uniref:fimbrillin family protein n=1 Tax=uncultured Bacteroides sp. TaxID=162156 RepID=UPI0025ECEF73|nr:fimbrillin family protein [uncultured Bacteroides sp.]